VTAAQAIDDYRILGIVKTSGVTKGLVLWDTSGPQARETVFELPSDKLAAIYVPERFMGSAPTRRGTGLHSADPNQRIVGVVCRAIYGGIRLGDDYIIIISTPDLRAYASTQNMGEHAMCWGGHRIWWGKWRTSATIMRVELSNTVATCISGSRFFAVVTGYLGRTTLLRIHDFSPGASGQRHPDRPVVQELVVNAARVEGQSGTTSWALSEDNLLMFHVSAGYWHHVFLVKRSDAL